MRSQHLSLPAVLTLALLSFACAGTRQGEDVVRDETIETPRSPRAGTGVLVVQNETAEPVEIYVEGDLVGRVDAGQNARFPNLPLVAATVEARSAGGEVVDAENLDFASAGDNTVTFRVEGL